MFNLTLWPASDCTSTRQLTVYDNKLAMICLTVIGIFESSFVDLWAMVEGTSASRERWSGNKKCKSRTYPCSLSPMSMWRNEIICKADVTESEKENRKPRAFICLFTVSTHKSEFLVLNYPQYQPYSVFSIM